MPKAKYMKPRVKSVRDGSFHKKWKETYLYISTTKLFDDYKRGIVN
jgi:hypothetical protein